MSRFALVYRRSGGLKPMRRELSIRPGRLGTAMATRVGMHGGRSAATTFRVRAKTIRGLRRALARARFASLPDPGIDPACSDCYAYGIAYRGHEVTFDDATMPRSLNRVVGRLEAIVDAHLPFH